MNIYELAGLLHGATGGDLNQVVDMVIRATAKVVLEDYLPDDELDEAADQALHDVRAVDFDEDDSDDA